LCKHPDEYGYSPTTAMSSAPEGYYHKHSKCEEENIYFDPLLTHSKSYLGGKIAVAKLQLEYIENESFPNNYLGYFDENMGAGFEMQWIDMTETLRNLKRYVIFHLFVFHILFLNLILCHSEHVEVIALCLKYVTCLTDISSLMTHLWC
jgi:hypothetical protein